MDPWVTNTQEWLNDTYTGVPGWEPITVTGRTGWPTMYALTRALQHELGITSLSDTFGPATYAAVNAISPINNSTTNKNIIRIIQGAMYCKGYNGGNGDLDGVYSATTIAGVMEMRIDMGLGPANGFMTAKVLKALLTMDAYVLVSGGDPAIRTIQRDLNGRYASRQDFYIIPADGIYSRGVQQGLMYALQYEIGMADGVANGNFGPGTQAGLTSQANFGAGDSDAATGKWFIHLFQAALTFNGYPTPYTGVFTSGTAATVQAFQAFCILTQTQRSDFQTWASLLVSTGDVNRPGTAADTIRTITPARAATLMAHGYSTIGRYLTNSPVPDPLDKNIKPGELASIFGAGMSVFPIFQEGGDGLSYFNYERGAYSGYKAHAAAKSYGFNPGTVIYFAVDFDAVEDEVWSNVVPHFLGIRDAFASAGSQYRVGVYGARNTCRIVSEEDLAELSFVSGMSTGYSGNLGFPLPSNWAFDQILEYEIGSGDGWVNIDKNIKSGRDAGQSSVAPVATNSEAIAFLNAVQILAEDWFTTHPTGSTPNDLVLQYLREPDYNDWYWPLAAGNVTMDFVAYVNGQLPRISAFFDPGTLRKIGMSHLAASANGVTYNGLPVASLEEVNLADLTGWAGDFISAMADYAHVQATWDAYDYGMAHFGGDSGQFDWEDYIQDVDGMYFGIQLRNNPSLRFCDLFSAYYGTAGGWQTRFSTFKTGRFAGDSDVVHEAARSAYYQQSNFYFDLYRAGILLLNGIISDAVSVADRDALCEAFRDSLNVKIANE